MQEHIVKHINNGRVSCEIRIDDLNLTPGEYVLVMPIHEGHSYLYRNIVKEFLVVKNEYLTWGLINFKYDYDVLS